MITEYKPETEAEKAAFNLFNALLATGMDPIKALYETVQACGREPLERFIAPIREQLVRKDRPCGNDPACE